MIKINGIEYDRLSINKDIHIYTRKAIGGEDRLRYDSVSAVLEKYKVPYNREYWSLFKAYQGILIDRLKVEFPKIAKTQLEKRSKEIIRDGILSYVTNIDPYSDLSENLLGLKHAIEESKISKVELDSKLKEVLDSWEVKRDVASTRGNVYHRGRELTAIKNGYEYNAFDNKAYPISLPVLSNSIPREQLKSTDSTGNIDLAESLQWNMDYGNEKFSITDNPYEDLPDGFYPEFMCWDNDSLTAGTSDRVFIETVLGERFVDIDDYKTNAKIDSKSFYVKGKGFQMMKPPVAHMMDCKHSYYHLQVSIYAYMMEKQGFTVRNVGYHHLNTFNQLPYLRDEAKAILDDFNYNRDKEKNDLIKWNKL